MITSSTTVQRSPLMSMHFKMEAGLLHFLGCLSSHCRGSPGLSIVQVKKMDPLKPEQGERSMSTLQKTSHQEPKLDAWAVRWLARRLHCISDPKKVLPEKEAIAQLDQSIYRKRRLTPTLSAPDPFHTYQLSWIYHDCNKYTMIIFLGLQLLKSCESLRFKAVC